MSCNLCHPLNCQLYNPLCISILKGWSGISCNDSVIDFTVTSSLTYHVTTPTNNMSLDSNLIVSPSSSSSSSAAAAIKSVSTTKLVGTVESVTTTLLSTCVSALLSSDYQHHNSSSNR